MLERGVLKSGYAGGRKTKAALEKTSLIRFRFDSERDFPDFVEDIGISIGKLVRFEDHSQIFSCYVVAWAEVPLRSVQCSNLDCLGADYPPERQLN